MSGNCCSVLHLWIPWQQACLHHTPSACVLLLAISSQCLDAERSFTALSSFASVIFNAKEHGDLLACPASCLAQPTLRAKLLTASDLTCLLGLNLANNNPECAGGNAIPICWQRHARWPFCGHQVPTASIFIIRHHSVFLFHCSGRNWRSAPPSVHHSCLKELLPWSHARHSCVRVAAPLDPRMRTALAMMDSTLSCNHVACC